MSAEPLFKFANSKVWWCRVRNPNGGRALKRSTGCRDRKAAILRWRELERASVAGTDQAANVALEDALKRRLDERQAAGRAAGTLQMLTIKGRQLCRVLVGTTPIKRIDAAMVDAYIETRIAEGASRSTIYKELVTLWGTLKLAKRRGEFLRDLAEIKPLDFAIEYKPKDRALSETEIDRLLGELRPERAAVVAFIIATSATYPSELATLVPADVDLRNWKVRLRGTKTKARDREVPIVSYARPWVKRAFGFLPFKRWTNVRRDLHVACLALSTCNRCREGGAKQPVEDCKACKATPTFQPVSPNDLRRTTARLLRAHGVEPQLIAPLMGHIDSRMVERVYGRISPNELAHLLDGRLRQSAGYSRGRVRPNRRKKVT